MVNRDTGGREFDRGRADTVIGWILIEVDEAEAGAASS